MASGCPVFFFKFIFLADLESKASAKLRLGASLHEGASTCGVPTVPFFVFSFYPCRAQAVDQVSWKPISCEPFCFTFCFASQSHFYFYLDIHDLSVPMTPHQPLCSLMSCTHVFLTVESGSSTSNGPSQAAAAAGVCGSSLLRCTDEAKLLFT